MKAGDRVSAVVVVAAERTVYGVVVEQDGALFLALEGEPLLKMEEKDGEWVAGPPSPEVGQVFTLYECATDDAGGKEEQGAASDDCGSSEDDGEALAMAPKEDPVAARKAAEESLRTARAHLDAAVVEATAAGASLNKIFRAPNEIEVEKGYLPFIQPSTKKRYPGAKVSAGQAAHHATVTRDPVLDASAVEATAAGSLEMFHAHLAVAKGSAGLAVHHATVARDQILDAAEACEAMFGTLAMAAMIAPYDQMVRTARGVDLDAIAQKEAMRVRAGA
jgi:hypothetical protein